MPQSEYDSIPGVLRSRVGYTGGDGDGDPSGAPPSYESVCARANTHTEALRLDFDPSVVSYGELVRRFASDPRVQRVRALPADSALHLLRRRQTRVAVWAHTGAQAAAARTALAEAGKEGLVPVLPPSAWHDAEEYHQHFLAEDKSFPSWSAAADDDGWGDLGGPGTAWGL